MFYGHDDAQLEHRNGLDANDVPTCWCLPTVEHFPNGNVVVIHNDGSDA